MFRRPVFQPRSAQILVASIVEYARSAWMLARRARDHPPCRRVGIHRERVDRPVVERGGAGPGQGPPARKPQAEMRQSVPRSALPHLLSRPRNGPPRCRLDRDAEGNSTPSNMGERRVRRAQRVFVAHVAHVRHVVSLASLPDPHGREGDVSEFTAVVTLGSVSVWQTPSTNPRGPDVYRRRGDGRNPEWRPSSAMGGRAL
jgi:hypothetical protein